MRVPFDELGLWIYFSDLEDGPAQEVVIPVGWPTWERRRFNTAVGRDPESPCGELRLRGDLMVQVKRTADMGWESLSLWHRRPGRLEIASITRVFIEGDSIEAALTLWEPTAP